MNTQRPVVVEDTPGGEQGKRLCALTKMAASGKKKSYG